MSSSNSTADRRCAPAEADAEVVLSRIAVFFDDWFPRLELLLKRCSDMSQESQSVEQERAELEAEKAAWKEQCESEVQHIQDVVDQLSEAWLRLEAEQRELLQAQSVVTSSEANSIPETETIATGGLATQPPCPPVTSPGAQSPPPVDTAGHPAPLSSEHRNRPISCEG